MRCATAKALSDIPLASAFAKISRASHLVQRAAGRDDPADVVILAALSARLMRKLSAAQAPCARCASPDAYDAPFLAPRDLSPRPSRNEPAYLPNVLAAIAAERGDPLEMVAAATTATARRFFQLDGDATGGVASGR